MTKRIAVYAGSFDPLTNSHMWMIEEGSKMFDELIVTIGVNPAKKCVLSSETRIEIIRQTAERFSNVRVDMFTSQYLVDCARSAGAKFLLRGVRNASDYTYESVMRNINGDIDPDVTTVFLMPPRNLAEVSSSMVRGLIGFEGWEKTVARYVSSLVLEKLKEAHRAR